MRALAPGRPRSVAALIFDAVQIHHPVADSSLDTDAVIRRGRDEIDFDPRTYRHVCGNKQRHAPFTQHQAAALDDGRVIGVFTRDSHRSVEFVPHPASTIFTNLYHRIQYLSERL